MVEHDAKYFNRPRASPLSVPPVLTVFLSSLDLLFHSLLAIQIPQELTVRGQETTNRTC